MELRDYLAVLKRRKWLIVVTVVFATVSAVGATALMSPKYTATTTLHVATPTSIATANVLGSTDYMNRIQNTYAQLAASGATRDAIAKKLHLSSRPGISVSLSPNTELMGISATTAGQPRTAAQAANLDATLLLKQVRQLGAQTLKDADSQFEAQMAALQAQIASERVKYNTLLAKGAHTPAEQTAISNLRTDIGVKVAAATQQQQAYETSRASILDRSNLLSVVTPAVTPTGRSGPSVKLAVVLGFAVGLIAAIGLALLVESLSTRMEATDEIEKAAGLPVLGAIPLGKAAEGALFNSGSPTEEAFRRLRTNILALERSGAARQILITSAEPNEGKSTVVANLAASLAQAGQRVVVVDADLRLPTLHTIFGVPNNGGLAGVVRGSVKLEDALRTSSRAKDVTILPSGGPVDHPAELLASPRTAKVLADLAAKYDVVLVDSPALLALADALSLATEAPDVLIVVSRNHTRREALLSVRKQLNGVGANALGVVVNRAEEVPSYHYYAYRR